MSTTSLIILIVVIVLVALGVAALAMAANRKKKERDRNRANELREKAVMEETEARRLEAEARDLQESADDYRTQRKERLRAADEMDPDVDPEGEPTEGRDASREGEAETGTHRA
jgi:uncharacterized protein YlxW (UPF0749 family)